MLFKIQFLKCEYFLVFILFYESYLDIDGFWTVGRTTETSENVNQGSGKFDER